MDKMDDILAMLTPEEFADALRFVEVWEKGVESPVVGAVLLLTSTVVPGNTEPR